MLSDHGTIGGYPKIGVVISADYDKLVQIPPGSKVKFKEVDLSIATKDVDAIHHLNSEKISAKEYAMIALSWAKEGAFVVGGCCGTTVEHTREIKLLMDSL